MGRKCEVTDQDKAARSAGERGGVREAVKPRNRGRVRVGVQVSGPNALPTDTLHESSDTG